MAKRKIKIDDSMATTVSIETTKCHRNVKVGTEGKVIRLDGEDAYSVEVKFRGCSVPLWCHPDELKFAARTNGSARRTKNQLS